MVRRLIFALCLSATFSSAQQNKLVVPQPDPVTVKRGANLVAHLKVATLPGFHVNSDKPSQEYLIPLKLTWADGPLEVKSVTYPEPETVQLGPDKLSVFTGDIDIATSFSAPPSTKPGATTMTGKLHYQACNNQMCFRPMTVEVHLPVTVE